MFDTVRNPGIMLVISTIPPLFGFSTATVYGLGFKQCLTLSLSLAHVV